MCHHLVLPNHPHQELLVVVEVVIVFGSWVAGLLVLACTHTPPVVDFTVARENHRHHSRGRTIAFHSPMHLLHGRFTSTHMIYLVLLP